MYSDEMRNKDTAVAIKYSIVRSDKKCLFDGPKDTIGLTKNLKLIGLYNVL